MRVLFVTEYLAPQKNGIATRCENYISHLRADGHNVTVFGPSCCASSDGKLYTLTNWLNKENSFCFPTLELFYEVIFGRHDVIHIVYPPAFLGFIILILAWLCGVKAVCSNHVNMKRYRDAYFKRDWEKSLGTLVAKYVIYYPQLLFCQPQHILSPTVSEDLQEAFNFETGIAPSAVDLDLFQPNTRPKSSPIRTKEILYVGRIAPEKNMIRLFDLSTKAAKYGYTLRVVGPGPEPYLSQCKDYVINNKLKHVIFEGPIAHHKLVSYYQQAAVFVSCSITETFGFTNLEALSSGCPLVFPRCQAFTELYEKDFPDGAFDLDNDEQFIQALLNVTKDEEVLLSNRSKAREFVLKNYSWEGATRKLVEIYQS